MTDSYPDGVYDSKTIVSHQEAKVYSFKSVGILNTDRWKEKPLVPSEIPIGIKTPVQFGSSNDGLFMMHKSMADQVADNFRNMIMTNHGERLCLHDFGADLEGLIHDLGTEGADGEAIRRIKTTTNKYMPYIDLHTFVAYQEQAEHGLPRRVVIKITYSVQRIRLVNRTLEVVLYTGYETSRQAL